MIKQDRHIIKRQILDLELPSEEGAHQLQRKLSRLYQDDVLPKLEEVFSHLSLEDRVLQIPELRIDLGTLDLHQLDKEFARKCVEALSKELKRRYGQAHKDTRQARLMTSQEHLFQSLLHFLERGFIQPGIQPVQWEDMQEQLQIALTEGEVQRLRTFRSVLKQNSQAILRAIFHLSDDVFEEFQRQSMIHIPKIRKMVVRRMSEMCLKSVPENILRALDIQLFLFQKEIKGIAEPEILTFIMEQWESLSLGKPSRDFMSEMQSHRLWKAIVSSNSRSQTNIVSGKGNILRSGQDTLQNNLAATNRSQSSIFSPPEPDPLQQLLEQPMGMQINLAGLPIIAPYLPAFFQTIGIVNGKDWISDEAKIRGMHLLYFLVKGEQSPEEYHLPLAKVLCAWPLDMPVPPKIELTKDEIAEAEELLTAIITHWKALKATTIEGLRETFLQRMGRLVRIEQPSGWLLQVERKSYDILLDRLPWTISSIKLPWMDEMIRVEW